MLPLGNFNAVEYAKITYPTRTYRLDKEKKRIRGYTDNKEAMEQAIYKAILTERYCYPIYNGNYGIKLRDLFGKNRELVCSLLEGRIRDALSADDRITDLNSFEFSGQKETVVVGFTAVTSVAGNLNMEVSYSV